MAKVLIKSEKSTSFEVFFLARIIFFGQVAHVEPHVVLFVMVLVQVLRDPELHMSNPLAEYSYI